MSPFQPAADGHVTAQFGALEGEIIADLANQVADLLDESVTLPEDSLLAAIGIGGGDAAPADPAVARLLPDAYREDPEASRDFRRLTEHSLALRKVANARAVELALRTGGTDPIDLDPAATRAWLRTFTDIRLVIASRLGIETDEDRGLHDTDEQLMLREVYDWLGMLQETLVGALDT